MKHRSVGTSGLRVSRLGLGTLTWGRDTDGDEAAAQLLAFAEAGGTLVDSSPRTVTARLNDSSPNFSTTSSPATN